MTADSPSFHNSRRITNDTIRKIYLILLSAHFRFLNLSENMGTSLTISSANIITRPPIIQGTGCSGEVHLEQAAPNSAWQVRQDPGKMCPVACLY